MPGILICMLHREIHPMFSVVVTACHVGGGEGWEEEYCSGKIIREIDQFSAAKTFIRLQGDYSQPRHLFQPWRCWPYIILHISQISIRYAIKYGKSKVCAVFHSK
jgi:hypothetical protein